MRICVASCVHEWIKPFKCDNCEYSCSTKSMMKGHDAFVHEGKKSFKCDVCDYTRSPKSLMKRHVSSVHEGVKTIQIWPL